MGVNSKKEQVWNKARIIKGKNPNIWRRDPLGNIINWQFYATNGKYTWEIDHIRPKLKGGSDDIRNLQALSKKVNRNKTNNYPTNISRHKK